MYQLLETIMLTNTLTGELCRLYSIPVSSEEEENGTKEGERRAIGRGHWGLKGLPAFGLNQ